MRKISIHPKKSGVGGICPNDTWWYPYLTGLGIASKLGTSVDVQGKVVALSGQVLRNYTEKEIRRLFNNNFVLLNADAVETLSDMGFGDIIGVDGYEWWKERTGIYTMEELATGKRVFGVEKLRATAQFFCGDFIHLKYKDGVDKKVYTNMLDYNQTVVSEGVTRVGNVLIFPYTGRTSDFEMPISLFCHLRAYVMRNALMENPVSTEELYFIKEENVSPYVFTKNGKTYIICVNYSDDKYSRINLDTDGKFFSYMAFTPRSERVHRVASMSENGRANIQIDLEAQSSAVLVCDEVL